MRRFPTLSSVALATLATLAAIAPACGGETVEEKMNRQVNETLSGVLERASGTEVSREQLDSAMRALGRNMDSLDLGGLSDVEVIGFRQLKPLMPDRIAGLPRTEHLGETQGMFGLTVSEATAVYESGERRVEAKLMDTGGAGVLLMGLAGFTNLTVDKETAEGSERTLEIDSYPAYEKVRREGSRTISSLNVLVNRRFVVTLSGEGVDSAELTQGFRAFRLSTLPQAASNEVPSDQ